MSIISPEMQYSTVNEIAQNKMDKNILTDCNTHLLEQDNISGHHFDQQLRISL